MTDSKVPSLTKSLLVLAVSILGLAAITALVVAQVLLLASLAAAPFGWSVPLLAIPSTLAEIAGTIASIGATFFGINVLGKVSDAL